VKRAGCAALALLTIALSAAAVAAYREHDYRARFAREAGELIAVRDSTGVGQTADGWRVTDVTLVSDTGLEVRVRVRALGQLDGVRRPAALVMGGYKTGRAVVEVPRFTGGVILASVAYPYDEPDRPRGIEWLWKAPAVRTAMMRTPPALLLAAQYLYAREDVDPERVMILGVSLGVPFATAVAATDRRIAGVALLYGGGEIERLFTAAVADDLPGWAVGPTSRAVALLLAPLEPTRYARAIAPRPLLMINASDDQTIPRESVLALYRAARRPKRLIWVQSPHLAIGEEQLLASLMDETLAWMAQHDLR
jgi:hypothetical protein